MSRLKPVVNFPIEGVMKPQRPLFNAGDSLVSGGTDGGYGTRAGYRRNPWPKYFREWLKDNAGYSWGDPFVRKTVVAQYKAANLKGTRKTHQKLNVYKMKRADIEDKLIQIGFAGSRYQLKDILKPDLAKILSNRLRLNQKDKTQKAAKKKAAKKR